MPRRRTTTFAALALSCALALSACSEDAAEDPKTDEPTRIDVSYQDGLFDPNGARVKVGVGQTVVVEIDADTSGALHVHSTPEQEIAFEEGTSEHEIVIDTPGVVEVESHDPDSIVLQLEVS